jgi:hypothetical protein
MYEGPGETPAPPRLPRRRTNPHFPFRRSTLWNGASILRLRTHVATEEALDHEVDPEASPFALPPIEGLPFDRDSEEAVAIRRVIEEADRERSGKDAR